MGAGSTEDVLRYSSNQNSSMNLNKEKPNKHPITFSFNEMKNPNTQMQFNPLNISKYQNNSFPTNSNLNLNLNLNNYNQNSMQNFSNPGMINHSMELNNLKMLMEQKKELLKENNQLMKMYHQSNPRMEDQQRMHGLVLMKEIIELKKRILEIERNTPLEGNSIPLNNIISSEKYLMTQNAGECNSNYYQNLIKPMYNEIRPQGFFNNSQISNQEPTFHHISQIQFQNPSQIIGKTEMIPKEKKVEYVPIQASIQVNPSSLYANSFVKLNSENDNTRIKERIKQLESILNDNYVCPIGQATFTDPVIAEDGHTYERHNIEDWLAKSDTSPITNEKLRSKELKANFFVKGQIEDIKSKIQDLNRLLK